MSSGLSRRLATIEIVKFVWYNPLRILKSKGLEFVGEKNSLDFLYNTCFGISKVAMEYWISVPEFAERIRYMVSCGVWVDRQVVFETMRSLYLDFEKTKQYTGKRNGFNFRLAKLGIESLWRSMTGTKEGWRGE